MPRRLPSPVKRHPLGLLHVMSTFTLKKNRAHAPPPFTSKSYLQWFDEGYGPLAN